MNCQPAGAFKTIVTVPTGKSLIADSVITMLLPNAVKAGPNAEFAALSAEITVLPPVTTRFKAAEFTVCVNDGDVLLLKLPSPE